MSNNISIQVKKQCADMKRSGITPKKIYMEYFAPQFETPMSFESFRRDLNRWSVKMRPDERTLSGGTYDGFVAHDATVQVRANGDIVQAWIKQKPTDFDYEKFLDAIRESVEPYSPFLIREHNTRTGMLEIPLFDMHFGISGLSDYENTLNSVLGLIKRHPWEEIVIFVGQDLFHNDSIEHGFTSNGTAIEKIDMAKAVKDARAFMYALIDESIQNGSKTRVIYTPGNHDRSVSWMFMQVLLERYGPEVVDDSFEFRKCVTYGRNAIMVTHGDSRRATPKNLASIFPVSFPNEFGNAVNREVHCGHLHHEAEEDIFGVMIRRLSSGVAVDGWSNKEDYIGAHKRFMVFEWDDMNLSAVHYV